MSELIEKAQAFATHAHRYQKRKYTDEPYIIHPEAVAKLVEGAIHTEEMVAAAWLHDVVEDCEVTVSDLHQEFGGAVAHMVEQVTDVSKKEDGNRAKRKALDLEHLSKACWGAKTIKLADLIDNTISIVEHDPAFAKVYLKEKAALLEVLKEGDATLWQMAKEQVK